MKTLLFALLMTPAAMTASAQAFNAPEKCKVDTTTTHTYKISKTVYKVYKSKNGAFYIWKTSKKTGKPYKMYLPKEIQLQMGRRYS